MAKLIFALLLLAYAPLSAFADSCDKQQNLYGILINMNYTILDTYPCQTVTYASTDDDRRLYMSFTTNLGENDSFDTVCARMLAYMNQDNWFGDDIQSTCVANAPNTATLLLSGVYCPGYNPFAPPKLLPLAVLGTAPCSNVVKQCDGVNYIRLDCAKPNGYDAQQTCDSVENYLNQNQFIEDTEQQCTPLLDGNVLLELKGNH